MPKIIIESNNNKIHAEINNSKTAKLIYNSLPLKITANLWGNEVYAEIPVKTELEPTAKEEVNIGDLGYWPPGQAFCIFFGKTPASVNERPRAASKVNIIGKVMQPEIFKKFKEEEKIKIIK